MIIKCNFVDKQTDSDHSYDWSDVKHFFIWTDRIWGKKYFVDISQGNKVSFAKVGTGKESYREFEELWKQWSQKVNEESGIKKFEYPIWHIVKHYKNLITMGILGVVPLILVVLLCALFTELQTIKISPAAFVVLAIVMGFILLGLLSAKQWKFFATILIMDNRLKVSFTDGTKRELSLGDVKRFGLDINLYSAFLVFNDGTKLVHLERVSYWPLLREYLLSKLGTNQTG